VVPPSGVVAGAVDHTTMGTVWVRLVATPHTAGVPVAAEAVCPQETQPITAALGGLTLLTLAGAAALREQVVEQVQQVQPIL
jgi:hypothetical protein